MRDFIKWENFEEFENDAIKGGVENPKAMYDFLESDGRIEKNEDGSFKEYLED